MQPLITGYQKFWPKKLIYLIVVGLLLTGILHGLIEILSLACAQWQQPNLFWDSFSFVMRDGTTSPWAWLKLQHNEHRIVWAKAASLVETELLKIPPGQSGIFQILLLILGCAGLWCWLCKRLLHRADLRLITALSGWLLLLSPWQYENLNWEFQTPWFLINALVMLGALLLSIRSTGINTKLTSPHNICSLLLPWIAVSSTGQGLAVAVAFVACSWLHSWRLGTLVSASSSLACFTFYVLVPYSKPSYHPDLMFRIGYFLRILLGGQWKGLGLLLMVVVVALMVRRRFIDRQYWPSVFMPGLFSLIFAGMTTLSRSGFGLGQANSSRYVSHSLMLGISALLALALIDDQNRNYTSPLLGSFLVLIITLGSFPQGFHPDGLSYAGGWAKARHLAHENRDALICNANRVVLASQNIRLLKPCKEVFPHQVVVDRYFQGHLPVKPLAWHQQILLGPSRPTTFTHNTDQQVLSATTLRLRGWAFAQGNPGQRLYLLTDYGIAQTIALPIDHPRGDVKQDHKLPRADVGFDASIPRSLEGKPLRAVRIGTSTQSLRIWQSPSTDG